MKANQAAIRQAWHIMPFSWSLSLARSMQEMFASLNAGLHAELEWHAHLLSNKHRTRHLLPFRLRSREPAEEREEATASTQRSSSQSGGLQQMGIGKVLQQRVSSTWTWLIHIYSRLNVLSQFSRPWPSSRTPARMALTRCICAGPGAELLLATPQRPAETADDCPHLWACSCLLPDL